jgi:hypothetical protein
MKEYCGVAELIGSHLICINLNTLLIAGIYFGAKFLSRKGPQAPFFCRMRETKHF